VIVRCVASGDRTHAQDRQPKRRCARRGRPPGPRKVWLEGIGGSRGWSPTRVLPAPRSRATRHRGSITRGGLRRRMDVHGATKQTATSWRGASMNADVGGLSDSPIELREQYNALTDAAAERMPPWAPQVARTSCGNCSTIAPRSRRNGWKRRAARHGSRASQFHELSPSPSSHWPDVGADDTCIQTTLLRAGTSPRSRRLRSIFHKGRRMGCSERCVTISSRGSSPRQIRLERTANSRKGLRLPPVKTRRRRQRS